MYDECCAVNALESEERKPGWLSRLGQINAILTEAVALSTEIIPREEEKEAVGEKVQCLTDQLSISLYVTEILAQRIASQVRRIKAEF